MKKYILFSLCLVFLFSCDKDEILQQGEFTGIELEEMEVGQFNLYHMYQGENYWKAEGIHEFSYLNDTLKVEIIDKNADQFLWKESFTPGSESVIAGDEQALKEFTYWVSIETDSVRIVEAVEDTYYSHLLYHFSLKTWLLGEGEFKFPLNPSEEEVTDVVGWKTTSDYHESYQEFVDLETVIKNVNYGKAHVIVDNVPMQLDGNGKTYVFSKKFGLLRTFTYSWWTGTGGGFDLIPN